MARDLQATETQATVPWSQMESQPMDRIVWGRLYGKSIQVQSIDLNMEEFSTGRCDSTSLPLGLEHLPEKVLTRMSKVHYTLRRENCDVNKPVFIKDCSRNGTFLNGERIGLNAQRILKDGDVISLAHPSYKAFVYKDLSPLQAKDLPRVLTDKYHIDKQLGTGACGTVNLIYNRRSCEAYAMKTVSKLRLNNNNIAAPANAREAQRVLNEAEIMKQLSHPCVITMYDIIDTPRELFMVLEYMKGGDLLSRIVKQERLSEAHSKFYFYQMCLAIQYLHGKGITHRDLKPDNVLLMDERHETVLKVSDFGLSKLVRKDSVMRTLCGTPMYVAPEVLTTGGLGSYDKKVDIWGLGIMLYTTISGSLPFSEQYGGAVADQIKSGRIVFYHPCWKTVSQRAKALVKQLLSLKPTKRPTIQQVLTSEWLRDAKMRRKVNDLLHIAGDDDADGNDNAMDTLTGDENLFVQPPRKRARRLQK